MHIATCFDPKESSSGYSINHNVDTSNDSAHFGIPKSLHGKMQVKFFCVNFLGSQNVYCHLMHLRYGSLNSLMMTS